MAKHYHKTQFDKPSTRYTRDYANLPHIARYPQEGASIFCENTQIIEPSFEDRLKGAPAKVKQPQNYYDVIGDKLHKVTHNLHETSRYVKAYNSELQKLLKRNVRLIDAIARLDNHARLNSLRDSYRQSLERFNSCYVCARALHETKAYIFKPSDFRQLASNLTSIDESALRELRKQALEHFRALRKVIVKGVNKFAAYAIETNFQTVHYKESTTFGLPYTYSDIKPHFRVFQNESGFLEYAFVDGLGKARFLKREKINGKLITSAFTDSEGVIDRFYNPPKYIRRFNFKCACLVK